MDQSTPPGYREGIEDSIRRCEELLALPPLAFLPSEASSRRNACSKELTPDAKGTSYIGGSGLTSIDSAEKVWKRNMDLLSGHAVRFQDTGACSHASKIEDFATASDCFQCQRSSLVNESANKSSSQVSEKGASPCDSSHYGSEWQCTSSEWTLEGTSQDHLSPACNSNSQVDSLDKSIVSSTTDNAPLAGHFQQEQGGTGSMETVEIASSTREIGSDSQQGTMLEKSSPSKQMEGCASMDATTVEVSSKGDRSSASSQHFNSQCSECVRTAFEESRLHAEPSNVDCQQENMALVSHSNGLEELGLNQTAGAKLWNLSHFPGLESQGKTFGYNHRSKSAPRHPHQGCKLTKQQRSKSLVRDRFEDRLQMLAQPRTEIYKKLAELKAALEKEKLQECSFKPSVGRKPDSESPLSAPIFERTIDMQHRLEWRKRARKAIEKEELDNCSFWPKINWRSQFFDKLTYQPIQERFQELQRQKIEKIANAQLRKEINFTFKPEINPKSIQLCKQKGLETVDLADRLTMMPPSVHADCKLASERNKSTFAPEINKNTDYIIASSKQFQGCSASFLERQKQYLLTLKERKMQKAKENKSAPDLTFRPDIGNSAIILRQSHVPDILQETPVERFMRLAYKDKDQLGHTREKVTEAYYSQFHFQPEIDGFSRVLAGHTSIYDLYKNEKGRKVKDALAQAARNEFMQKCPFRPEVKHKNDNCQLQSLVLQRRQVRKDKASCEQESRTLRELEELKECTFKPCVNPSPPPKEPSSATIRGLERHLELQYIAKQMKREQEELERKVFFSRAYVLPVRQYTIPRPFVLQTSQPRYHRR